MRPSTRVTYRRYLDLHILPVLGSRRLDEITADVIRAWHNEVAPGAPTVRARAYAFLKTVLGSAVDEDRIPANPCRIRGVGNVRPATEVVTASPAQVAQLAQAVPERFALAILLGAWCQIRVGECLALRRRDVDVERGVIHVRQGVTWQDGAPHYGPPKTAGGLRSVHMPPAQVRLVQVAPRPTESVSTSPVSLRALRASRMVWSETPGGASHDRVPRGP